MINLFHILQNGLRWKRYVCILCFLSCSELIASPVCTTLSPVVSCVNVLPNGDVSLTWETPNPVGPTFNSYHIYTSSSASGPFVVVDSIFNAVQTTYTHVGANASGKEVYYFIQSRCGTSDFSDAIDTLRSIETPEWDSVSVNDANKTTISWKVNKYNNVKGYVIYTFNGSAWVITDTVLGKSSTNYTYILSKPDSVAEQYRLAVYDSCGNLSPLSSVYTSINLTASANICNRSAMLSWNEYPSTGANSNGYRVYLSTVGPAGPYSFVDSVGAGELTYEVNNLQPNTTYYFKVVAFDKTSPSITASSNRLTFYSATPLPPSYLYLRQASVDANGAIELLTHVDVNASVSSYKVFRSEAQDSSTFIQIGTILPSVNNPLVFTDTDVSADKNRYIYKVTLVDSCGFDGLTTNIARNMVLSAVSNSETKVNTLIWNNYIEWEAGTESYNIYRGVDGVMEPTPIANLPATGTFRYNYEDDVSDVLNGQGTFSYYIEAVEGGGNVYGFSDISRSNVAIAYQDPIVFIPSAFHPSGDFNKEFKPVTTYVNVNEYLLTIYNRMGIEVFSTNDITQGWDGNCFGNVCGFGVYVYTLSFVSSKGKHIYKAGSLTLIR